MKFSMLAGALLYLMLFTACSTQRMIDVQDQSLLSAAQNIPEQQLLDVGIVIFDPGLPQEDAQDEMILPEIRRAEARFIPVHLRNTLQQSGQWGAVRVIPKASISMGLIVNGTIIESGGETLSLHIIATDVTGKVWLDAVYNEELTDPNAYLSSVRGRSDAFQNVYIAIANDLLAIRNQQSVAQIININRVALLRFSEIITSDAFSGYMGEGENKLLQAVRMPAENDPMFIRVKRIRGRDAMLVDTIDSYYESYYNEMWASYAAWRTHHREEARTYRKMQASARNRYLLGTAAIAGAIALAVVGVDGTALLQGAMIAGGAYAIKAGYDKSQEAQINAEAIKELDESFNREVRPMTIDIEGKTIELTGSAQAQYQAWQNMLSNLYAMETGFESGQPKLLPETQLAPP